jgi:hypothetical protein
LYLQLECISLLLLISKVHVATWPERSGGMSCDYIELEVCVNIASLSGPRRDHVDELAEGWVD